MQARAATPAVGQYLYEGEAAAAFVVGGGLAGRGAGVVGVGETAFDADGAAVEVNQMVLEAAAYVLEYDFEA